MDKKGFSKTKFSPKEILSSSQRKYYKNLLRDLEAYKSELQTTLDGVQEAINGIRKALGLERELAIGIREFGDLSIADAAIKLMTIASIPLRTKEIVHYLKNGGIKFDSKSPYAVVHSTLSRQAKIVGDICRKGKHWVITEIHGE